MKNESQRKNIYVILGVARSGTSVISKALNALGVDLGDKLTQPGKWNPKGFWEDHDIVFKVNEKIISSLGHSWDSLRFIDSDKQTSDELQNTRTLAIDLLKQRFENTPHWGFKDPRTCRMLSFWQPIFEKLDLQDHYIIALRNPLSSAQSYRNLTGCDMEKGLILWLIHLLPAVDSTQHKNRVFVSYDAMLADPHLQLERIRKVLPSSLVSNPAELDNYSNKFLDKKLYHYEHTLDDLKTHSASVIAPLCLKAYELLLKVARDELSSLDEEFISAWKNIKNEFEQFIPFYNYADTLQQRICELEKSLRRIHKSRLWKMISPLRKINDALREQRRKKLAENHG